MDMEEKETRNRRLWTYEETIAFLKCYKLREWEMSQSRKKTLGYDNILGDLIFMGVAQSAITTRHLQSKMNSLSRAYHRALYIESINGEGSSGFVFMKLMKDILQTSSTSGSETFTNASSTSTSGQSTSRVSSTLTSAPSNLTRTPSVSESVTNALSTSTSGQSTSRVSSTLTSASSTLTSTQSFSNGDLISQDESEESKNRVWKYEETLALINCFASREEESRHPKKGKNVFKNILEDLESMNVLTAPTTELNVKQKWDRLLHAYKTASDAELLTGRGSSTFMYMDKMDEIFSDRPIMANSHTVNLYGENIEAVPLRSKQKKSLPVNETDTNDEEESFIRSFFPDEEINSVEVEVEVAESSKSKNVENATNVKQAVPRNIFRLLDPKNVAGTSSNNVPKNQTSNRTATIVSSHSPEREASLIEVAGFNFEMVESNTCMGAANVAASIAKPAGNVLRTLPTKTIVGTSANNLPKKQISSRTTPTVIAAGQDTRSLLMTEMGLDDEYVDVSKKSRNPISQKSTGDKTKKLPYSFRRNKTGKEIAHENREKWEREKLKRKSDARMEQIRFLEEKKQKRHEERCNVMAKYLEKL